MLEPTVYKAGDGSVLSFGSPPSSGQGLPQELFPADPTRADPKLLGQFLAHGISLLLGRVFLRPFLRLSPQNPAIVPFRKTLIEAAQDHLGVKVDVEWAS